MKDSTKLFLSSFGMVFCGFLKGITPTTLNQPFGSPSFLGFFVIAIIVAILGMVKHLTGR